MLMVDTDWEEVDHFQSGEFVAPHLMDKGFMLWLDGVRELAGVPMPVTSSHRTPEHNRAVGGAKDSAHVDIPCQAVDIAPRRASDRFKIVQAALTLGCTRLGVYADGSVHLDRTEDIRPSPALWVVVSNPA